MPIKLNHRFVILSEGIADKNFLSKLIANRLPAYSSDFPYPTSELGGVRAFEKMLRGVRGDRVGFERLKGILIVADSASDPIAVFRAIVGQIKSAEYFPTPEAPSKVAAPTADHPSVCVTLIPGDDKPGGLETLCNLALRDQYPQSENCVENFLSCEPNAPVHWSPEKLDKARYHAYVASCYQHDPSRALSYAFKEPTPENPSSLLDITSSSFDEITARIKTILDTFDSAAKPSAG